MSAVNPGRAPYGTQRVDIHFLYLDLDECTRCRATDANLLGALKTVAGVLADAGTTVTLRKTLIDSEEAAREHRFVSSPTIRVNGRDIALDLRESVCESCGEVAGGAEIDCRVWFWQGEEYTEAPPALIIDAILAAVYGGRRAPQAAAGEGQGEGRCEVPENLKRFFAARAAMRTSPCCGPAAAEPCCAPASSATACCAPGAEAPSARPGGCC